MRRANVISMPRALRAVTVVVNPGKRGASGVVTDLKRIFRRHAVRATWVQAHEPHAESDETDLASPDGGMIVVVGGDGTLLQAARRSAGSGVPLTGINAGSLGFLTSIPCNKVREWMPRVLAGEWESSPRLTLAVRVRRAGRTVARRWALNEASIFRGHHAHMVRLGVDVDGHHLSDYLCDGLIVATPTGSTAYSLSAGGPIVSPEAQVAVVTPICAHALTNRPLVLDAARVIRVAVPRQSPELALSADGSPNFDLNPGDEVEIRRDPRTVRLAYLPGNGFFEVLRAKLRWSGSVV